MLRLSAAKKSNHMNFLEQHRILRRKIRRTKYNWLSEIAQNGSSIANYLLKRKGRHLCKVKSIAEEAEETFVLFGPSPQTRIAPNFFGEEPVVELGKHSSLNAYLFKNAIVSPKTSIIGIDNDLLAPSEIIEQRDRLEIDPGVIGYINPKYAYRFESTPAEYESAILISGNGASNWYHFVSEIAPKAFLTNFLPSKFDDFPLIVPNDAQIEGPFWEILQALQPHRRILKLNHESARIRNLVTFDEVSHGPFNMVQGSWPIMGNYSNHEQVLKLVFQKLRDELLRPTAFARPQRRIFIVRPETRRTYNQLQLLEIAQKYNFEPVSPEAHSLTDQAQMFADASHVVGASGAAWTNMVFAPKPFKALTWIIPQYSQFCSYSMLALLLGHHLRYLTAQPTKKIRTTHDAFLASYHVSPIEFEEALIQLIGKT